MGCTEKYTPVGDHSAWWFFLKNIGGLPLPMYTCDFSYLPLKQFLETHNPLAIFLIGRITFAEPETFSPLFFPLLNIIWKLLPKVHFINCSYKLILRYILFYSLLLITSLEAPTSIYVADQNVFLPDYKIHIVLWCSDYSHLLGPKQLSKDESRDQIFICTSSIARAVTVNASCISRGWILNAMS